MNVFILNTGRCGSTTFIKACQHISNYSAAHESRIRLTGSTRLDYPNNHIEADNRLSWFLGRLDQRYGDNAIYIHLQREHDSTVESFSKRSSFGIMKAYREGIYLDKEAQSSKPYEDDYINTVNANIELFLKDKTHKMIFHLQQARQDFRQFWQLVDAEGDIESALLEWDVNYNHS
jgi:hypothetical protein